MAALVVSGARLFSMENTPNPDPYRQWRDANPSEQAWRWSIAASLALHVGVAIGAVLFPAPRQRNASPVSVTVRLLTREEFEATARPVAVPAPEKPSGADIPQGHRSTISPSDKSRPAPPNAPSQSAEMVRATELFSANVLAEEGSRQVRETLPLLARADRVMQLCNIEAVEQIRRTESELQPDYVVADAITDAQLHNVSLRANGGAFRSRGSWYKLRYHCTVTASLRDVASFEFLVGDTIPKKEWKKLHLTIEAPSQD